MTPLQTKVIGVGLSIGFLKLVLSLLHYGDVPILNDFVTVILGFSCLFVAVAVTQQFQTILDDSQATLKDARGLRQFGDADSQSFDFEALVEKMQENEGVEITNRRFRLNVYPDCFVGSEAVDWLVQTQNYSRSEAVRLGQQLLERGFLQHVSDDIPFRDDYFFYQFRGELGLKDASKTELQAKLEKIDLGSLVKKMREPNGLEIKDRRFRLQVYVDCFVGSEAVDWMTQTQNLTRLEAVALGQLLVDRKIIHHVVDEQAFRDEYFFYRFYADE